MALEYTEQEKGFGGGSIFAAGPAFEKKLDSTGAVAEVAALAAEAAGSEETVTLSAADAAIIAALFTPANNEVLIAENLTTHERVIIYDVDVSVGTESMSIKRGVSYNPAYFNMGLTTFYTAFALGDIFRVLAIGYDVNDSPYKLYKTSEGVEFAVSGDNLKIMTDQDGMVDAYSNQLEMTITTRFPLNIEPQYRKALIEGSLPLVVDRGFTPTANDNVQYQAVWVSRSGLCVRPISILVIPMHEATCEGYRDSNEDLIHTVSIFAPKCYPQPNYTATYAPENQVNVEITFDVATDKYFGVCAFEGYLGAKNS